MSKGAAIVLAPGDSPKRGLDTLDQKGHIGRSVAVVVFLAKFKIQTGSGRILNFAASGLNQSVGSRRRISCKIQNSKFGRGERPNFEF